MALVPIGTSAFAQSEDDDEEQQNDDSNNYYTTKVEGQTVRVYPDGRHIIEETGYCYYVNPAAGTTYECESNTHDPRESPGTIHGVIPSSPED